MNMDSGNRLRILLVEDDEDHRYFIKQALDREFYEVTSAVDGGQGLLALAEADPPFDVVILDYHLPTIDGLEFLKKAVMMGKKSAFIFLTVDSQIETAVAALKAGAMEYLAKSGPFYRSLPQLVDNVHLRFQALLEKQHIEAQLHESEEKFRNIFDNVNDGIFVNEMNPDYDPGGFIEVNNTACRLLGLQRSELLGLKFSDIIAVQTQFQFEHCLEKLLENGCCTFEISLKHKSGRFIPVESNSHIYGFRGRQRVISIMRDISERKKSEVALQKSLAEKELLLKEIHHRVKNNLSVIDSILYFQSQQHYNSPITIETLLTNTRNRIKAMVLVHEKLYNSRELDKVNFAEYCHDLVNHLIFSAERTSDLEVNVRAEIEPVYLNLNIVIPCGLIINELVTNALKYAFSGEFPGSVPPARPLIRIRFSCGEDGKTCELRVSDNGRGLPEDIHFDASDSLGMFIVHSLTEQLSGVLSLSRKGGACFTIRFLIPEPAQRI